jgi:ketosteroid isomerase-like protein
MKRKSILFGFAFLLLFPLASIWAGGGSEAADIAAVTTVLDDYGKYLLADDIRAWADLHAEDIVKMPPDSRSIIGREDLYQRNSAGVGKQKFISWNLTIEELEILGDRAYTWGYYSFDLEIIATGDVIPVEGKFLTIYRKESNGSWVMTHDCFNSIAPPAM